MKTSHGLKRSIEEGEATFYCTLAFFHESVIRKNPETIRMVENIVKAYGTSNSIRAAIYKLERTDQMTAYFNRLISTHFAWFWNDFNKKYVYLIGPWSDQQNYQYYLGRINVIQGKPVPQYHDDYAQNFRSKLTLEEGDTFSITRVGERTVTEEELIDKYENGDPLEINDWEWNVKNSLRVYDELDYDELRSAIIEMRDFLIRADIVMELELSQDRQRKALVVYFSDPSPSLYCFLKDDQRLYNPPVLTRQETALRT